MTVVFSIRSLHYGSQFSLTQNLLLIQCTAKELGSSLHACVCSDCAHLKQPIGVAHFGIFSKEISGTFEGLGNQAGFTD